MSNQIIITYLCQSNVQKKNNCCPEFPYAEIRIKGYNQKRAARS